MKKRTNRYFHRFGLKSWPIYKVWIAGFMAVVLLAGSLVGAGYGSQLVALASEVAATVAPSPDRTYPAITFDQEPLKEEPEVVKMEVNVIQQDMGIDLFLIQYADVRQDRVISVPMLDIPFNVLVTDEEGNTESYPIDTETGTLLLEEMEPGTYTVTLEEQEGYWIPEAQEVEVKEKIVYTVKEEEVEEVKDKVVQSSQVVESQEDNAYGNDSVITEALQDTVTYADSKTETVAGPSQTTAKTNSSGYMLLSDGTVTDYKPVYEDGNLVAAQRDTSRQAQAAPLSLLMEGVETLTEGEGTAPTETPAESTDPTASPEVTNTPDPTPTAAPTETPTAAPTQAPTAAPTEAPTATPTVTPTTTPAATPTPTPTATPTPSATQAPAYTTWPDTIKAGEMSNYNFALETKSTSQTVYTGWQTINGNTYYYDPSTHQPVTGQQVIQGIMYTFDANGVKTNQLRGIDVSKYQGNINWSAVKNDGIDFAIIRAGYRGYGTGALVEDSQFKNNIKGATSAGIPVGIYFYSQAVNEEEAREEALMVIGLVKGYKISYPIYFDTEKVAGDTGRADGLSASQRTACAVAFCETIRAAGYTAGVYSYRDWFYYNLNYANISKYRIWIAQYRSTLDFKYNYQIWQYTSSGTVSGISGRVDMNITR